MPILTKQNRWLILVTVTSVVFAIVVNAAKSGSDQSPNTPRSMSLHLEQNLGPQAESDERLAENTSQGD